MADFIQLIGTAGWRFTVLTQQRSSVGTWLELSGCRIILDPGPGTLLTCWQVEPALDPRKLDAVICSHGHIDHCTDANLMVEAMTGDGHQRRGKLLAPSQTLDGDSPLCQYVQPFVDEVVALGEDEQYPLGLVFPAAWAVSVYWFPALVAWLLKSTITRYGGTKSYMRLRPLFMGLVFGEFFMALFWIVINFIYHTPVPGFPWI